MGQAVGKEMGQGDELNNPTPPRFLEFMVGLLVPRASREHVLGDMHERYRSRLAYIADAASAVPAAIVSQIRRTTPTPFLLLEALVVYASFLAAAVCLRRIDGPPDILQVAAITVIVMAGLLIRDAYSARGISTRTKPWLKLLGEVYLTIYFSCGVSWVWQLLHADPNLHPRMMTSLLGLAISSILILLLRIWIETIRKDGPRGI